MMDSPIMSPVSTMDLSIGLITINAKYIHTSLSIRYLRNAARQAGYRNVWIQEFIITDPIWKIAAAIQQRKPDVLGVSIYIWNRQPSFQLIELLKKQNPDITLVIGGPEVSFEPKLSDEYVTIAGEGETKWVKFLEYRRRGEIPSHKTLQRWNTYGNDLPELAPPYIEEDFDHLKNRIAYLETSRGCPYLCSFCISALDRSVRYFDVPSIRRQIEQLVSGGVKKIKFIDRTFNLRPQRMQELMQWLTRFPEISFHFEVVGDLLNDDMLNFLETVLEGMFQFEIGIQTTDTDAQTTIKRKQDNARLFSAIERLIRSNRIHLHCDLIFGLPGETLKTILASFTEVFLLKPQELQLGFLKFLPGAPIRELIQIHGYRYQSHPPYELISHNDLTADQLIYLKKLAEVFDHFYNSKRFEFSIHRLLKTWESVDLFDHLLKYMETRNLFYLSHSLDQQYRLFADAFSLQGNIEAMDLLKLDYLYHQKAYRLPSFMIDKATIHKNGKKTWEGDRRTPLIPFFHDIRLNGSTVRLDPSPEPVYYALVHPEEKNGYIKPPAIKRVGPLQPS